MSCVSVTKPNSSSLPSPLSSASSPHSLDGPEFSLTTAPSLPFTHSFCGSLSSSSLCRATSPTSAGRSTSKEKSTHSGPETSAQRAAFASRTSFAAAGTSPHSSRQRLAKHATRAAFFLAASCLIYDLSAWYYGDGIQCRSRSSRCIW